MTESSKDASHEQSLSSAVSEAQRILEEITQLRSKVEEQLTAVELARKNTDSEALLAFNAKKACEEHSTAIAALKGNAESDQNSILANKQKSDELMAAVNNSKAAIDSDQKTINERQKEVDRSAQEIVKAAETGLARLEDINSSKDLAEAASKSTKDALAAATQANAVTEEAKKQAEKFSSDASALTANISDNQKTAKQHTDEIQALLSEAQTSDANLKNVWEHLEKSDEIARKNEETNARHSQELDALTVRIEALLPGATSAGLASSFNAQKDRFKEPQKRWLWTFVGCIGALTLIAFPSFLDAVLPPKPGHVETWGTTWLHLTLRLPIMLPLVWLAIYAGRNYMLSLRLEEDYAYKEAISTAFEGYKREMEKIAAGESGGPSPITILCTNVLRAIAERPGRMYEGKQQDINLATEAYAIAQKGADFSKKQIAGD